MAILGVRGMYTKKSGHFIYMRWVSMNTFLKSTQKKTFCGKKFEYKRCCKSVMTEEDGLRVNLLDVVDVVVDCCVCGRAEE